MEENNSSQKLSQGDGGEAGEAETPDPLPTISDSHALATDEARAVALNLPGSAPVQLSRERITPQEANRKGGISGSWQVKITLLPDVRSAGPEKGSDEYWRLKSRGLISNIVIPGHDSGSFRLTVSSHFSAALKGREWMPLNASEDVATSRIHLAKLAPSHIAMDQTFGFLADHCLIQKPSGNLALFIAPVAYRLSWAFIRRLPRRLPRSTSNDLEDFWGSKDNDNADIEDSGDEKRTGPPPPVVGPSPREGLPPPAVPAAVKKLLRNDKGKYPCPYSSCIKSRVPFRQEFYLIEHLEGRHEGWMSKFGVCEEDAENSPTNMAVQSTTEPPPTQESKPCKEASKTGLQQIEAAAIPSSSEVNGDDEQQLPSASLEDPAPSTALGSVDLRPKEPWSGLGTEDSPPDADGAGLSVLPAPSTGELKAVRDEPVKRAALPAKRDAQEVSDNTDRFVSPGSAIPVRTRQAGHQYGPGPVYNSHAGLPSGSSGLSPNGDNTNRKRRRTEDNHKQGDDHGGKNGNDRQNEDGEDDGSDEHGQANSSDEFGESKKFACPFYKYDPEKYILWQVCPGPGWKSVHRVKEHLYRKHSLPPYRCPRCSRRFDAEPALNTHAQELVACQPRQQEDETAEGVDQKQIELLKRRKKPGMTEVESWTEMYKILFPDASEDGIPTPWVESRALDLDNYRRFLWSDDCRQTIQQGFADELQTICRVVPSLLSDEVIDIMQKLNLKLIDAYQKKRQGRRRASSEHHAYHFEPCVVPSTGNHIPRGGDTWQPGPESTFSELGIVGDNELDFSLDTLFPADTQQDIH